MKNLYRFLLVSTLLFFSGLHGQPAFELIAGLDLQVVGITPINLDRWGVSVADIDGNGWPDVFETKWRGGQNSQIYMNTDGMFTEVSAQSPQLIAAEMEESWTRTPSFADYDNDGDKDLFWGSNENMFLFRNDNGVFVNVTSEAGLLATKPPGLISWWGIEMGAWADYDLDGDLDLIVNQTSNPDYYFYRNDDGVFTNIAADVGLTGVVPLGFFTDQGYWGGRIQWVDFDSDGDPDFSAGTLLFRNDNGVFSEVSQEVGLIAAGPETRFSFWIDYDGDADLDFLKMVCCQSDASTNELWANEGGQFTDVSAETGIAASVPDGGSQRSVNIADFDNDGDQDIFVSRSGGQPRESFLLNDEDESGGRVFADVGEFMPGLQVTGDRSGGAALDYDMDGFIDNFVASAESGVYLFHNLAVNTENHWVGFILHGTVSNRDATGSHVTLVSGGKRQSRHTTSPDTWKVQENPFVHFGIGTATTIDSVIIRWPLGMVQVMTGVAIDQYHQVSEPNSTSIDDPDRDNSLPETFLLSQNYPNPFNAGTSIEYSLPEASHVTLTVYNLQGQTIATLVDARQDPSVYRVEWDGRDGKDQHVASGVYLYRLTAGNEVSIKKMLFLK